MAGDWIKMRLDLPRDPAVVGISSRIKRDIIYTVGALSCVWGVFDEQTSDGVLLGYSPEYMDNLIGCPGFCDAMIAVGWLDHDAQALVMPNFDRHNGQSAKTRITNATRQKMSRNSRDKTVTREEKRKEEIKHLSSSDDERGPVPDPKAEKKAAKDAEFTDWATRLIRLYNPETEGKGHKPARSLTQELKKCLRKLHDRTETVDGKVYRFSDSALASAFVWAIADDEWGAREGVELLAQLRGNLLGRNITRALELHLDQLGAEVAA